MSPIAQSSLAGIVAVGILLMLIRPWGVREVYWVGGAAALLIALQLISLDQAGKAVAKGIDVYLFLIGMMLLSELASNYGVFDWLSSNVVRSAGISSARLFTLIYGAGALVTILMSNDATAVVLTPAILNAVRRARVTPFPHLFACAMVANAASFVLPISNPANLVVFHANMPALPEWLASFGGPSALSILGTYAALRLLFRKELRDTVAQSDSEAVSITPEGRLVLAGVAFTVIALLAASAMHRDLGLPTCLAAFAVTSVLSLKARTNSLKLAREISWATLVLVAGLFILVNAVESIGALRFIQTWLERANTLAAPVAALVVGLIVAVANNVVNNLPLGLLAGATLQAAHTRGLIANAVLIGVDLGPNLSITGSLATILWLLALRRERLNVGFWQFFKVGAIVMPVALLASLGGAIAVAMLRNR